MYQEILHYASNHDVTLVAVSKTRTIQEIENLYNIGQYHFGENRVQELVEKHQELPKDIYWHLIGSLQKNKVKYIAPFVYLIHSIDSIELLQVVHKEAEKINRKIDVLIQVHIATEDSKQGFSVAEILPLFDRLSSAPLPLICIKGLMGMATFTDDTSIIRKEFEQLKRTFDVVKSKYYKEDENFHIISMGMSGDYQIAIEAGSTMIRVGSAIFGARS